MTDRQTAHHRLRLSCALHPDKENAQLSLSLAQSPGLAPRRRQPSPTIITVPRENNRTSLSSRTGSRSRFAWECGGIRARCVASRCCYDSASVVLLIVIDKCCCYCCAVVAPKCPPPPIYMFMFRSRRATLTKRLTKAARKRRPQGGGADDCAASANVDILLRQLQDNQLEMLLRAVERSGGDCVLVRKERSQSPSHLLCCQTWRWPEVRQASELRRLPSCRSASDPVYVCCNPYHWSRLCQPGMCGVWGECVCVRMLLGCRLFVPSLVHSFEVSSSRFRNSGCFSTVCLDLKITCECGMLFSKSNYTGTYSAVGNITCIYCLIFFCHFWDASKMKYMLVAIDGHLPAKNPLNLDL